MKSTPLQLYLEPFIELLKFETCTSISTYDTNTGCTTLQVCDTGHLNPCFLQEGCEDKTIDINGIGYRVKDYTYCEQIIVEGNVPNAMEYKITIPAPKYLYGTPVSINEEITKTNSCDKYPLVYLFEPITETFDKRWDSCIEREVTIKLFFMNVTDPENNCNKDFVQELLPMRNLAERFVELIENDNKHFSNVEFCKLTGHSNFGRRGENGYFERYFDENLNAYQLDITFSINKKSCSLKCYCNND